MDLAGELVLARNQILQFAATQEDTAFVAVAQRLNLITSELQEEVMKTRMRPISTVWNRYPRMVRDLTTTRSKSEAGLWTWCKASALPIPDFKLPWNRVINWLVAASLTLPKLATTVGVPANIKAPVRLTTLSPG